MPMWKCPACGRQFARRQQTHSCVKTSPDSFFEGRPEKFRAWFQTIMAHLSKFGEVQVDSSLSCINLKTKSSFAALKFSKNSLDIEFVLNREENVFPIIKAVKINKSQYAHMIRLSDPEDLDQTLLDWLAESFRIRANT